MIEGIIPEILLLASAIPIGLLIARLAWDELIQGRKWFRGIFIAGLLGGAWFFLIGRSEIGFALLYVAILGFMAYVKSWDKKWTKARV